MTVLSHKIMFANLSLEMFYKMSLEMLILVEYFFLCRKFWVLFLTIFSFSELYILWYWTNPPIFHCAYLRDGFTHVIVAILKNILCHYVLCFITEHKCVNLRNFEDFAIVNFERFMRSYYNLRIYSLT